MKKGKKRQSFKARGWKKRKSASPDQPKQTPNYAWEGFKKGFGIAFGAYLVVGGAGMFHRVFRAAMGAKFNPLSGI